MPLDASSRLTYAVPYVTSHNVSAFVIGKIFICTGFIVLSTTGTNLWLMSIGGIYTMQNDTYFTLVGAGTGGDVGSGRILKNDNKVYFDIPTVNQYGYRFTLIGVIN